MSDERWVIVPNWDRFQHYSDRDPVWIKLYTELNSRADWLQLSVAERGLLCTIWVEYARSSGIVSAKTVQKLCNGSARGSHWRSLSEAGLIELSASKPLALTRVRDRASAPSREKKKRREEDAGASERAVDSPSRPRQEKKTDAYRRAENMTRNAGWQYEPIDFLAELEKFDLDPGQRHDLEQLRLSLINGAEPELDW